MGNQIDRVLPGLFVGGFLGEWIGGREREGCEPARLTTARRNAGPSSAPAGMDRKKKLQEQKITHILAIHDNAEPEYTVSLRGRERYSLLC